ncbi:hypothetical protein EMCRGX_G003328 [Ephydatia muelleri]
MANREEGAGPMAVTMGDVLKFLAESQERQAIEERRREQERERNCYVQARGDKPNQAELERRGGGDEDLTLLSQVFVPCTKSDVSKDLVKEMILLKKISLANLGDVQLSPLQLLNKLHDARLESLFLNVCISLRIFCTLPVTVASAERSFSQLKRIKSYGRSTMAQERFQGLALLCIESELTKTIDYDSIIGQHICGQEG